MKKVILLFVILFMACFLAAVTFPAHIVSHDLRRDVKAFNKMDISIEAVSGDIIQAWVTDEQFNMLHRNGYDITAMPDVAKAYADSLWEATRNTRDPMNEYYSYNEYVTFLQNTATQYSNICQLIQIGSSVQNRAIYMLKISDNVGTEENEPEVEFDAAIHGNEVVGYDLLMRLIQQLTTQYASNQRIADIVNNTEIWINPLFNPDGYVLHQRENANGVDLNRHFPDFITDPNNTVTGREPEIAAHMNFRSQHTINQGLNYHCGALVMNYPWDKIAELAPDDDLYIALSETYSVHNSPMWNSMEFTHGITNGYAWYQVYGSIIDWAYYYYGCLDITCEVSNDYWPAATTLPTYWSQNQESLLSYIEYAQKGIRGVVRNTSNEPLSAMIHVEGNEIDVPSDPGLGDYHRILLPGTYTITASAPGYISQTVTGVSVTAGTATDLNFTLQQTQMVTINGCVKNLNGLGIPNATISLNTSFIPVTQTNAEGFFQLLEIPIGVYTLSASINGVSQYNTLLNLNDGIHSPIIIVIQPTVFEEHFENGLALWQVTGTWGLHTTGANHELADSPTSNYTDNLNTSAKLIQPVNLANVTNPMISFRVKFDLEVGYDYAYFEASANGANWTIIGTYNGTHDWQNVSYSLATYAGGNCYLRFRFYSDVSEHNYDGIFIDDLVITGNQSNLTVWGDVDEDGMITKADAQAILDYSVGGDPLTAIDPRPWTAGRVSRADANADGLIHAADASLVMRFLYSDLAQLPVQSGQSVTYTDPVAGVSNQGNEINLYVHNFNNLYALNAEMIPTDFNAWDVLNTVSSDSLLVSTYISGTHLVLGYASLQMYPGFVNIFTVAAPGIINPQNPLTVNMIVNETPQTIVFDTLPNDDPMVPGMVTQLKQNIPNPFNPETSIRFDLAEPGKVDLAVYNIRGELVRVLQQGRFTAGSYQVIWNGVDRDGRDVASGVYLYRLQASGKQQVRKMLLVK